MSAEAVPVIGLLTGPTVLCPLDGCDWTHTPEPQAIYPTGGLDAAMGVPAGTIDATQRQRFQQAVERTVDHHLRGHSVIDWLTTVARLKTTAGEPMVLS